MSDINQEDIINIAKLCEKNKVEQITRGNFDTLIIRTDTQLVIHHVKGTVKGHALTYERP